MTKPISGGGRPQAYRLSDGRRVPGVTTICNRFKDSGGLIHWAWRQGLDGLDYRETKDAAAEAGHIVHERIDAYIHNRAPAAVTAPPAVVAAAGTGFDAFMDWATQVGLNVVETETPLISEEHGYGGTFDAIARVGGRLVLFDWKTGGGVYAEYIWQVAAYRQLLRERGKLGADIESAQLIRFGKVHADFHHHMFPSSVLDMGWACFRSMLSVYPLDAELRKVL